MDTHFWLQVWDSNDVGFDQRRVNPHLLTTHDQTIGKEKQCIFVPLCGQSIDLYWLWQQGHDLIAVEISAKAIETFFARYEIPYTLSATPDNNFNVYSADRLKIFCGDYFALQKSDFLQVDWVYDRAALVALPVEMRRAYAEQLIRLIQPSTQIWLLSLQYASMQDCGPPFSIQETELHQLFPGFNFVCLFTFNR